MPIVPVSPGPRIPLQPLRVPQLSPNAPAEAFGGGVAAQRGTLGNLQPAIQGFEAIGAEQARMAYQEKARADQVAITDAAGKLAQYRTDSLYANQNGVDQSGWLGLKGKNAFDMPEKAQSEFWQVTDVMRNSLTNDDQKAAFDKIAQGEWDQMHGQIQQHVARERVVYDNDATQGALDAKRDQAIRAYDDPSIVEPAIQARAAIIETHAQRNGLPEDFAKEQVAKATSDLRLEVLQQFVDNKQDMAASSYLNQHKADFIGKALTQAETLTNRATVEGEAIRQADIITGMKPTPDGSLTQPAGTEDAALREAAKIDDPQVREKTEQRITLFFNRKTSAQTKARDDAFQRGYEILRAHGGDVTSVPLTLRNAMGATHDENLTAEGARLQKLQNPGDPEQFTAIMNQAYFNPDQFAQIDIQGIPGLNTTQKTRLMTLQRTIGYRAERRDETTIQRDVSRAQADARFYQHKAEAASAGGDKEGQARFGLQQSEAETNAIRYQEELNRRHSAGMAAPTPPRAAPVVPHSAEPASHEPGPATVPGRSSAGRTPLQKPTPQMLQDIAKHGPGYAEYLRHMGIDAPDHVIIPEPPKKKP